MIIKDSDRETHLDRWLEIRRNGLTATEVGQIASGKASVAEIVERKQRGYTVPPNPFTEWGNIMEPHILDWLSMMLDNVPVIPNSHIVAWDDDPRLLSTPDGFTDNAVVECKTTGKRWEKLHDNTLSPSDRFKACSKVEYYFQHQTQLLTCNRDDGYFTWNVREVVPFVEQRGLKFFLNGEQVSDPHLLFYPGEFDYIDTERSEDSSDLIKQINEHYWAFYEHAESVIPGDAIDMMRLAREYESKAKELRAKALELVKPLLRAGEKVSGYWGSVSCSERTLTRFDTSRFKHDNPELFSKYSSESTSTQIRFTLKDGEQ